MASLRQRPTRVTGGPGISGTPRGLSAIIVLSALATGGCTANRHTVAPAADAKTGGTDHAPWTAGGCAVTVRFGSFATGIDRKAALRAERLIRAEAGVTGVTRSPPGIEGEYALCVRTSSRQAAARMFERLRQAFTAPVRAPVSITGPDGRFSAPLERRFPPST